MFVLYHILFFHVWFVCLCDADKGKVFGGRFARKGEFPSAVAILGASLCGGTIFALDKVLTAAHCMVDENTRIPHPIDQYKIYGGTLKIPIRPDYKTGDGAQIRTILSAKAHEGFSRKKDGSSYHDVAFIVLTKPFIETETLSVAKFPSKNEKDFFDAWKALVPAGKKCNGVGWGTTKYKRYENGTLVPDQASDVLKVIELTPVDQKTCSEYTWYQDKDMTEKGEVCVSPNKEKNESVCSGDSGSPLYCDGYAFALARAVQGCGPQAQGQFYVLFGHYFDYFGLGIGSLLSTNIHLALIFSMTLLRETEA